MGVDLSNQPAAVGGMLMGDDNDGDCDDDSTALAAMLKLPIGAQGAGTYCDGCRASAHAAAERRHRSYLRGLCQRYFERLYDELDRPNAAIGRMSGAF